MPQFTMESTADATVLHIAQLLRVSHSTLLDRCHLRARALTTWRKERLL